jgi:hypothetical protein
MISRSRATIRTLLGAALVATFVAGCGSATATATATRLSAHTAAPSASVRTSAGTSAGSSASPRVSGSAGAPTAEPTLDISAGLAHFDAKLEALLPGTIGDIPLSKLSMPLSTYLASETCTSANPCGDKALYTPWLVELGKTPDDATLAAATDLTKTETIVIEAFTVPGIDGAKLSSSFAAQARKAGWPVTTILIATKSVQELIDPVRQNLGLLAIGYLYAHANVMYLILTDNRSLLLESVIKLP